MIWSFLKKPPLECSDINNYWLVSNIPFLGKVIKHAVTRNSDEMDYLDLFQSGFKPGFGMETAVDWL